MKKTGLRADAWQIHRHPVGLVDRQTFTLDGDAWFCTRRKRRIIAEPKKRNALPWFLFWTPFISFTRGSQQKQQQQYENNEKRDERKRVLLFLFFFFYDSFFSFSPSSCRTVAGNRFFLCSRCEQRKRLMKNKCSPSGIIAVCRHLSICE